MRGKSKENVGPQNTASEESQEKTAEYKIAVFIRFVRGLSGSAFDDG